ncbi:hypothetical protein Vretimale_9875 [Volvox reticuliferus]|uniref:Uncharacterized protein n=1 Tax=Volvox reticuliferus TaxID=1737510 RepID=A0A8J4GDK7_9CHLO|nr:hypothetical protein Vretimale_9875 [Volvox reticuliferus]
MKRSSSSIIACRPAVPLPPPPPAPPPEVGPSSPLLSSPSAGMPLLAPSAAPGDAAAVVSTRAAILLPSIGATAAAAAVAAVAAEPLAASRPGTVQVPASRTAACDTGVVAAFMSVGRTADIHKMSCATSDVFIRSPAAGTVPAAAVATHGTSPVDAIELASPSATLLETDGSPYMDGAATLRFAHGASRLCPGVAGGGESFPTDFAFRSLPWDSATGTAGLRECVSCTTGASSGTETRYNSDCCQSATGPTSGFQILAIGAGTASTVAVSVVRPGLRGSDPQAVQTVAPQMRV